MPGLQKEKISFITYEKGQVRSILSLFEIFIWPPINKIELFTLRRTRKNKTDSLYVGSNEDECTTHVEKRIFLGYSIQFWLN